MKNAFHSFGYLWIFGLLVLSGASAKADALNAYKAQLVKTFGVFHYQPLLLPEGHKVGDVIDMRDFSMLRGQDECFPGLQPNRGSTPKIPALLSLNGQAASAYVTLRKFLGLDVSGGNMSSIALQFEDVSIKAVTLSELKSSLSDECAELKVLFEGRQRLPKVFGRPAIVLLATMDARVSTVFSYRSGVNAEAELANLEQFLGGNAGKLSTLTPEVAASLGLSSGGHVRLSSPEIQTVGFRPSSIMRRYLGGGESSDVEVVDFDDSNKLHLEALNNFGRAWAMSGSK